MPDVKIISPWKEKNWLKQFKGRTDLINYAKKHKIPIDVTQKKPYSTDENLMHISFESGILEDTGCKPKQDMFKLTKKDLRTIRIDFFTKSPQNAPDKETEIIIEFKQGIPVKIINKTENKTVTNSLKIFTYLNKIAGENAIGRIDIVENRFVGLKSRGIYETPAGTILFKAHNDLESITLDKEVIHLKEIFSPIIAKLIYNGFWYSPEMEMLMTAINQTQKNVTGKVYLTLYKGNIIITGRKSKFSLYDKSLSSMDMEGGYDQKDAEGFIKINGLRFKMQGVYK